MTSDAQAALRRIIEQYSATTRFCIICNYISKIIDPLASRCVKFRFSPIAREAQIERLSLISSKEGVKVEGPKVYERLVEISQGDLRRSINMLQTASAFKEKLLSVAVIESISGVIPPDTVTKIDKVLSSQSDSPFSDVQLLA